MNAKLCAWKKISCRKTHFQNSIKSGWSREMKQKMASLIKMENNYYTFNLLRLLHQIIESGVSQQHHVTLDVHLL